MSMHISSKLFSNSHKTHLNKSIEIQLASFLGFLDTRFADVEFIDSEDSFIDPGRHKEVSYDITECTKFSN